MESGPVQVQAVAEAALALLAEAFASGSVSGSREQWAGALGSLQRVLDVAGAAQDAAIVQLAAIEPDELDDGTVVESHRAVGHVALDAPAIVSGVLSISAVHAERRVRAAVLLAADGPAGTPTESGLGGLHLAMAGGMMDPYRAGVVAEELLEAPAPVRAAVVAALHEHFDREDAAHLRRRCRRALARVSPDLLVQRARRARAESGLRRWAEEPGVDRWEGTFPSEDAAHAWAAIDALARRYVTDGSCATIERARAKALTDLVAGSATIDTVVTLTVPATVLDLAGAETPPPATVASTDPADLVAVTGPSGAEPVLVSRAWLTSALQAQGHVQRVPCHPGTGALLDASAPGRCDSDVPQPNPGSQDRAEVTEHRPADDADARVLDDRDPTDAYRPSARLVALVKARDRRCRFPACSVSAVFCDVDHVRPWPAGPTSAANLMCLCRRHHRIKQRHGWRVALGADGTATWTDPTGRARTTLAADALRTTVLPGAIALPGPAPTSTGRARTVLPEDAPHSHLDFLLQHLGAPMPVVNRNGPDRRRTDVRHEPGVVLLDLDHPDPHHHPDHHHHRRPPPGRCRDGDPPPF